MGAAIHALYDPLHGELLLGAVLCHECHLRLHLDGRQRRLQLVRGVRSERAFPRDRKSQSRQQLIDRVDERTHFYRSRPYLDRLELAGIPGPYRPRERFQRREAMTNTDPDQQRQNRQRQSDWLRNSMRDAGCQIAAAVG
jgi:hypothetical protein